MIKFDLTKVMNASGADPGTFYIGQNDLEHMEKLIKAWGSDHRKFMKRILVSVDITAPLYWWEEFGTCETGTAANSCSTMHTIADKEFTLDDFSHEHLFGSVYRFERDTNKCIDNNDDSCELRVSFGHEDDYENWCMCGILETVIRALNVARNRYLETKDKKYWWQMIQLIPSSYNQRRTVTLNYEVLRNMYHARKNHKLDEWGIGFVKWVESLPCSKLITMEA